MRTPQSFGMRPIALTIAIPALAASDAIHALGHDSADSRAVRWDPSLLSACRSQKLIRLNLDRLGS